MGKYDTYVEQCTAHFKALLEEQLEREDRMEADDEKKDFANLDHIVIGFCGGDGIGPVITAESRRLVEFLLKDDIASGKVELKDIDGLTIENRLAVGKAIPDDVLAELKTCDVIMKGPTTTPTGGTMESANVAMRRELDLYANVRPTKVPSEDIDWIFFRENTEGEYVLGSKGVEVPDKLAFDFKVTTKAGTERICRAAFEYAKNNGKDYVAIVTKANIMKKTDGNFTKIAHEVAKDYPDIKAEDWFIDIMTANLVNQARRSQFQVFVMPNLYGDIITDEAAQIQGGVGTAGSGNLGDKYCMFEAIHGSAPRMIEEGRGKYANPCSMFKASEMMLRHIGYIEKADKLAKALEICNDTERKYVITGRDGGATCEEFGNYVMETVSSL
ncbi:MAG: isocitrate/isopropylmalate dehydrogenase family protein [Clostridia bacterium]|nr:isocitrate/isopropylmalate dehydrogenase family protein [Clostridia bacterium]